MISLSEFQCFKHSHLSILSKWILNRFYICTFIAVRTSLENDGELSQIKAEMRTKVMKLLEGSNKSGISKQPKSPREVLIVNELIREYLDWMGYKYTSTVLVSGMIISFFK